MDNEMYLDAKTVELAKSWVHPKLRGILNLK
jgi:hypothetical protein